MYWKTCVLIKDVKLKVIKSLTTGSPLHVPRSGLVHCQSASPPHTWVLRTCVLCSGLWRCGGVLWCWLIIVSSYFAKDTRTVLFFSCRRELCLSTKTTLFEFGKQCSGLKLLPVFDATGTWESVPRSPHRYPAVSRLQMLNHRCPPSEISTTICILASGLKNVSDIFMNFYLKNENTFTRTTAYFSCLLPQCCVTTRPTYLYQAATSLNMLVQPWSYSSCLLQYSLMVCLVISVSSSCI